MLCLRCCGIACTEAVLMGAWAGQVFHDKNCISD
jgi:hypothetical protein